jgi:hypothetical protein
MARPSPFRSSVFRLSLAATAIAALVAAFAVRWIAASANATLTAHVEEAIEADVATLRATYAQGGMGPLAEAVAQKIRWGSQGLYLLIEEDGRVRAGNVAHWPAEWKGERRSGTFTYVLLEAPQARARRAAGVGVLLDGGAKLLVAQDIEHHHALLATLRTHSAIALAAIVLLGVVGGYLVSRQILRRIDEMSDASRKVMVGHHSGRLPVTGTDDELDRLARQLNAMLDRIEQLMSGLREVSDNIAHDLKTPLNRLRNAAEAALADPRGPEAWRAGLERTLTEADDLIKTFNALLLIARLESGSIEESFEPVDLAELCRSVVELYEPHAEEHGLKLQFSGDDRVPATANRHLVSQAVANLIDNAIKYGQPDAAHASPCARIVIGVAARGEEAIIHVADNGPGIPAADRARALQRFTRLDSSRSRPGTGLGLSLVAAVAQVHGGRVALEDNKPGLRVVVSLPLAPRPGTVAEGRERSRSKAVEA